MSPRFRQAALLSCAITIRSMESSSQIPCWDTVQGGRSFGPMERVYQARDDRLPERRCGRFVARERLVSFQHVVQATIFSCVLDNSELREALVTIHIRHGRVTELYLERDRFNVNRFCLADSVQNLAIPMPSADMPTSCDCSWESMTNSFNAYPRR